MESRSKIKVVSLLWGFSIGGVGKYASIINGVSRYAPIDIETICILSPAWHCDRDTLAKLSATEIVIKSRFDMSWIWKMARELNRTKPDLIMTHGFNGHIVSMISQLYRGHFTRSICSYHGMYHAPSIGRKPLERIFDLITETFIRFCAAGVVSVSEYSFRYLNHIGVDAAKVTVIHNGIDDFMMPSHGRNVLRKEWGISDDHLLLGVASRLDPVKGINYLIKALAQSIRKIDKLKLAVVGTGTIEGSLKQLAADLGIEHSVIFPGFRTDIDDCLAAFDIFILPSLAEYHSIALLEAMRAQKAIIATDVGGNTESVRHEIEGLIVPPMDTKALSLAIERLAADKIYCEKIAKAALERFNKEFTTERMVRKTAKWICSFKDLLAPCNGFAEEIHKAPNMEQ